MQIERLSVPGAEVLAIQGQLDATTATQLEGALEDAADYGGGQPLVVDLAGVGLISSAALRVLLSAAKRARRESGKIHLCAANTEVRKVFEISGLAALFDLHDTREDALTATGASTAAAEPATAVEVPVVPPVVPFTAPESAPVEAVVPPPPVAAPEPPPVPPPAVPVPVTPEPTPPVVPGSAGADDPFATAATSARAFETLGPVATPVLGSPALPTPPPIPPAPAPFIPPVEPLAAAEATAAPLAPPPRPFPVAPPVTPPPPVPPPARARAIAAPPPPAPARVPGRTPTSVGASTAAPAGGARRPFPVFPLIAGALGVGLVLAATAYFVFNRLAPKTGMADVTSAPTVAPAGSPTPSAEPSIVPMDSPTPEPSVVPTPAADGSPTPTPTPALVAPANVSPSATPISGSPANGGPGGAAENGEANRVAAPSQVNFDPADPRNAAVRESVLKRIESMPVSRKVKDQLYAALERARGMGRVATITFGAGRTDLSTGDIDSLRKGLAQPVTARLKADPTVVIVVLGYADNKGDAAANRKLSEQRAARTIEVLKGPCGLMNVMHSVGMGASELLDGKNSEANRAVEVWAVQP